MSVKARYLMYTEEDRTKAYRLDVENDGKVAQFWINGQPCEELPKDVTDAVLLALTTLDTTFGALMIANKEAKDGRRG